MMGIFKSNLLNTRRDNEAGFTLVEMLVAMFIFSLISVGTMSALTTTISAKEQIKTRFDGMAELETGRALIMSDMANLRLRQSRDAYGNTDLYVLSGGVNALIDFTRGGRDNPGGLQPRGDLQRVRYVFEDGQLIRRAFAHENPSAITPEFDRVLLRGLLSARIEFITNGQAQSVIYITPEDTTTAPDMIRLEAVFEDGGRMTQYFEIAS